MNTVWKNLFLFSLGLTLGTTFCMKALETEFDGFTILGLELIYSPEKITSIFQTINDTQLKLLRYNLGFDFAFMTGIYPLIASLCMLAKNRAGKSFRTVLSALALLQIGAWALDILENIYLLKWSYGSPVKPFTIFHFIVWTKWVLAISGLIAAFLFLLRRKNLSRAV